VQLRVAPTPSTVLLFTSCVGAVELVFSLFVSSLTEPFGGGGAAFLGSSGSGYSVNIMRESEQEPSQRGPRSLFCF
jgi:hypothetical protein